MKPIRRLAFLWLPVVLAAGATPVPSVASPQGFGTALDGMELLASGASAEEMLEHLLGANIGVEPEYLGVAFHNTETGGRLDRGEIRELMGPIRQDGGYQLLAMAVALGDGRLPYTESQLQLLLDAAFIASMRQPPSHISIEFFDVRQGPTGVGGGVSGRVPERSPDPGPGTDASVADSVETPDAVSPLEYVPATDAAILAHLERLGVSVPKREGKVVLPLLAGAASADDLDTALDREIARYERELGVQLVESIATLRDTSASGVPRVTLVGYFSGAPDTVQRKEAEIGGFFYQAEAE